MKLKSLVGFALCISMSAHASLDMGAHLKVADADTMYPGAAQIEMIRPFVPAQTRQPAPNIDDRVFWADVAASESGKALMERAAAELEKSRKFLFPTSVTGRRRPPGIGRCTSRFGVDPLLIRYKPVK